MVHCSGVDVYTALAGATGALYGPLHGGANEVPLWDCRCLRCYHLFQSFEVRINQDVILTDSGANSVLCKEATIFL